MFNAENVSQCLLEIKQSSFI